MSAEDIKSTVRDRYGKAALRAATGTRTGCCGGGSCGTSADDPITSNLYTEAQTATLPAEAVLASLGCGNPTALADLHEGEVVLDLGPAAASTCCSRPGESAPPGKHMAST